MGLGGVFYRGRRIHDRRIDQRARASRHIILVTIGILHGKRRLGIQVRLNQGLEAQDCGRIRISVIAKLDPVKLAHRLAFAQAWHAASGTSSAGRAYRPLPRCRLGLQARIVSSYDGCPAGH